MVIEPLPHLDEMLQFSSLAVVHQNADGFLWDDLYPKSLRGLDALASARLPTRRFASRTLRRRHILVREGRTGTPPIRVGCGHSGKGDAETFTTDHSRRNGSLSQGRGISSGHTLGATCTCCALSGPCTTRRKISGCSGSGCFLRAHRMKLQLTSFTSRAQRCGEVLHTNVELVVKLGTLHLSPAATCESRVVLHRRRFPAPFGCLGLVGLLRRPLPSRS